MLGAALLFVIAVPQLGLGATLAISSPARWSGRRLLGLFDDPSACRASPRSASCCCCSWSGSSSIPSRLWRLRHDIFGLGLLQVVLCGLALEPVHPSRRSAFSLAAALAIGLPLALSSTAQVLPMLRADGELNTPYGERAFSILLFQDLSIVPLITIIAAHVARAGRSRTRRRAGCWRSTRCWRSSAWCSPGAS